MRGATLQAQQGAPCIDFNSRTSCEVRLIPATYVFHLAISTHAPLARCDSQQIKDLQAQQISTHAPLARCDETGRVYGAARVYFNSRTSCEVRQNPQINLTNSAGFQLTHLLRGATCFWMTICILMKISTHAPLARCDASAGYTYVKYTGFQLTHLLRGATQIRESRTIRY